MTIRNVVLTQHQHELVDSLVKSGRYQDASEVLREGLRLLEREESEEAAKIAALSRAAGQGWLDLASGRFDDLDDESLDELIGRLGRQATEAKALGVVTPAIRLLPLLTLDEDPEQPGSYAGDRPAVRKQQA